MKINLPKPKGINDAVDAFVKFYNDYKRGKKPVWDFDDLTNQTMTFSIKERLSDESLRNQKDLNGRGFLNQFVTSVFMLGMEHGQRCYEHYTLKNKLIEYLVDNNLPKPKIEELTDGKDVRNNELES